MTADRAIEFVDLAARIGLKPAMIIHDRDSKFVPVFDGALKEFGLSKPDFPTAAPT